MEPILKLERVGFRYGMVWVLQDIHLEVQPGEILGILGPNGSGKSTLLRIMDGMLNPHEGNLQLKGHPLSSYPRQRLARELAMVGQENYFRFAFTVLEVVLMGRFPHLKRFQFEGKRDMEVALDALHATQALDLAERSIHEISGGEKQRVLIARALAQEPSMILLDEPTSFLDLRHKRRLFRLISSLNRDKGLSVVLVSHDIDLAAHYCHRLVMLKKGRIMEAGPPRAVLTRATIEEVYDCPVFVDQNPATGKPRVSLIG